MAYRKATAGERRLLSFLERRSTKAIAPLWMDKLLVEDMSDGGMGSLRLRVHGAPSSESFAEELASCQFRDADGVDVIATLYADRDGFPFELDVWKVDFTSVTAIPETLE